MKIEIAIKQQLAQLDPYRRATRIANLQHRAPLAAQILCQPVNLSGLAHSIDPVQGNEQRRDVRAIHGIFG